MSDVPMEDWAGEVGERWLAHLDRFESMIAPAGAALLDHCAFGKGESVVDVGCGPGANSFDIARAVGSAGSVTGIDISPALIAKARERLAGTGLANVRFEVGDAERARPAGAPFDRLFSRFGVMFFGDTEAAFANMRQWLRPGGRADFSCWAAPEQNPWIAVVGAVVSRHAEMPQRAPGAPGPFRLADAEATRTMLEASGFDDVSIELWEGEQLVGGAGATPAQAAEFVLAALGMTEPLREAGADLARVRDELEAGFRPFHRDAAVRMDAAAWLVTAVNPERAD